MANVIARVTASEVCSIIKTTIEDLSPFILVANQLVTELLGSSSLTAARLKEIERWLSAHFVSISGGGDISSESIGDASVSYNKPSAGDGLASTSFGVTALSLDTTGALKNISGNRAYIESL